MFYNTVTVGHSQMFLLCRTDLIVHQQTTLGKCCHGSMHVDWLVEIYALGLMLQLHWTRLVLLVQDACNVHECSESTSCARAYWD